MPKFAASSDLIAGGSDQRKQATSAVFSGACPRLWLGHRKADGRRYKENAADPNIPLANIPECQKYLDEGSHRRLYTWSETDYFEISGIWGNGEVALPDDQLGELEVVEGMPDGGKMQQLVGVPSAFTPDYAPEEMYEIAAKLYQASR